MKSRGGSFALARDFPFRSLVALADVFKLVTHAKK
jgi:hypothetical protein